MMRPIAPFCLLALCLVFSLPVLAQTPVVIGAGGNSCGKRTNTIGVPGHNEYEGWVLGFISAYDMYVSTTGHVNAGTDARGLLGWIDNYCSAHPLEQINTAAVRLIDELRRRGAR
jgi:hypothetical protein